MARRFVTLDVFTSQIFAGNPLAVVLDAEGLAPDAMQAIAKEFALSETVFVLPPENPAHRAKLRIFTPARELPFAGHPTVGTAVLLGRLDGGAGVRDLVVEEAVGPVRCRVEPLDAARGRARFDLPRLPEPVAGVVDAGAAAAALGLSQNDIGFDSFVPESWSAGVAFTLVPLKSLDAVGRAKPDMRHWGAAFGTQGHSAAFVFSRETAEPGHAFHARMFASSFGIGEDPATGAAVAAFAGAVARHGGLLDGDHDLVIEQGFEMGRPSRIVLSLALRVGVLTAAAIGGEAVVVSEGRLLA
ncbi:MAG: PhzF family phenazine biosynthesis protein [Rhodoplanes sp.]|uniref:PhzF family phenazine biosynthesis protein n=1 Tax=Rhodoplanes sp. TaxID=1968906 RepID=UPI0018130A57|nr:PhzF family phenazine biosynthesis protein [Rhodoplanes sp.]NVO15740.1 PhzF family phenazine biosynthesis protein [Rhodoplanes sp.]